MQVVVHEDIGRLEVEVEQWRFHAVQGIHAHGDLVNHLKFLWPHQIVAGEETVQGSITHVVHHNSRCFSAQSVNGHYVLQFQFGYSGCLVYYSPVIEKKNNSLRNSGDSHATGTEP